VEYLEIKINGITCDILGHIWTYMDIYILGKYGDKKNTDVEQTLQGTSRMMHTVSPFVSKQVFPYH